MVIYQLQDGPTVDGLTSSPSEIASARSYDGASDPFTSCSTKEIEPTKEIDPSTTQTLKIVQCCMSLEE
ncbi:hypothetical protein SLEP1_g27296 [Rubroshorea leprosula]|uniref:Uncharacterized protein n=1 Tax=Rubroshorea leprosula TaxID=152421 RepID=A0AAV5JPZ0_9ROSI|nr:hypothetical protein SLEP1_g27296 [Rubroshorea leprosula]